MNARTAPRAPDRSGAPARRPDDPREAVVRARPSASPATRGVAKAVGSSVERGGKRLAALRPVDRAAREGEGGRINVVSGGYQPRPVAVHRVNGWDARFVWVAPRSDPGDGAIWLEDNGSGR